MDMAWIGFVMPDVPSDAPAAFIMSKTVAAHIIKDIPATLTFASNVWAKWIHDWASKYMLQPRYFNAKTFDIIELPKKKAQEPNPILNAYEIPADPVPAKVSDEIARSRADEMRTMLSAPPVSGRKSSVVRKVKPQQVAA